MNGKTVWKMPSSVDSITAIRKILAAKNHGGFSVRRLKNGSIFIDGPNEQFTSVTDYEKHKYIVVSDYSIGIDAENIGRKVTIRLQETITPIFNPKTNFFLAWQILECLGKISGDGISIINDLGNNSVQLLSQKTLFFQQKLFSFQVLSDEDVQVLIVEKGVSTQCFELQNLL